MAAFKILFALLMLLMSTIFYNAFQPDPSTLLTVAEENFLPSLCFFNSRNAPDKFESACTKADIKPASSLRRKFKWLLYTAALLATVLFITVLLFWQFYKQLHPVMEAIASKHHFCNFLMTVFQGLLERWDSFFGTCVYSAEEFWYENYLPLLQMSADWYGEKSRQLAKSCVALELLYAFLQRMPVISSADYEKVLHLLDTLPPAVALLFKLCAGLWYALALLLKHSLLLLLTALYWVAYACYKYSLFATEHLQTLHDGLRPWEDLRQRIRSANGLTLAEEARKHFLYTRLEEIIPLAEKLAVEGDLDSAFKLSEEMLAAFNEITKIESFALSEAEARAALRELDALTEPKRLPKDLAKP